MDRPLSDDDLRALLGTRVSVLRYPDLHSCRTILDALDDCGRAVVLFETVSETEGHWFTILVHPGPRIECFDSFGTPPDGWRRWLSAEQLRRLHETGCPLSRLLRHAEAHGVPVTYNTRAFQSKGPRVATCGRHAVMRLLLANWPLQQYARFIDAAGPNPDDTVTRITDSLMALPS
jgi:hypothetical protein